MILTKKELMQILKKFPDEAKIATFRKDAPLDNPILSIHYNKYNNTIEIERSNN
jgi:hypothetical protein